MHYIEILYNNIKFFLNDLKYWLSINLNALDGIDVSLKVRKLFTPPNTKAWSNASQRSLLDVLPVSLL